MVGSDGVHAVMPWFTRMLLLVVALFAGSAFAQNSADLTIEARVLPAGEIRPGTVATIVLTMRNLGPSDAVGVGAVSSDYLFLTGGLFDLFPVLPSACHVDYDDFVGPPGVPGESFLIAIVLAGNIPPGGSRACTMGLFVYPESRGPYDLSFRVDSGTPDDNASNDTVVVTLVFAEPVPRPIPATRPWALLTLVMLVAVSAILGRGCHHDGS